MTQKVRKTVWISKYALTKGLYQKEVETHPDISDDMVSTTESWSQCFHKPDWHDTYEEAIIQALLMQKRKLASLAKQMAIVKAMTFRSHQP